MGDLSAAVAAELFRTPFVQATLFLGLFMLADPQTAPGKYPEQVVVGLVVGAASVAAEILSVAQAYFLVGLLFLQHRSGHAAVAEPAPRCTRRHATLHQ